MGWDGRKGVGVGGSTDELLAVVVVGEDFHSFVDAEVVGVVFHFLHWGKFAVEGGVGGVFGGGVAHCEGGGG